MIRSLLIFRRIGRKLWATFLESPLIVHEDFTFPVACHGTPLWGAWARPISHKTWFGLTGALTLTSPSQIREGVVEATMYGFATRFALEASQQEMDMRMDAALSGTLLIDGVYYPRCLFLGWAPSSTAFFDGSGQHGWVQMGTLRWQMTRWRT